MTTSKQKQQKHPWRSVGQAIISGRPREMPFVSTQTHVSDVLDAIPAIRLGFSLQHRTMESI